MTDANQPGANPAAGSPEGGQNQPNTPDKPEASGGETIYRTQEQFDSAFNRRWGAEKVKLETTHREALDQAKKDSAAETAKSYDSRIVDTSVRSLARDLGYHDPSDALAAIDRNKLPIKDGEADEAAIKEALEAQIKAKPYLAKAPETQNKRTAPTKKPDMPGGNADRGSEPKMSAADALRQLGSQRGRGQNRG